MEQSCRLEGRRLGASVSRFGSFTLLLLAVVGLFAVVKPVRACAQENILRDSNLTLGKDTPDSWSTQAWQRGADFTTFNWKHTAGARETGRFQASKPMTPGGCSTFISHLVGTISPRPGPTKD